MIRTCPQCGGRVLTATMTPAEEPRYAAAFLCTVCGKRMLEEWPKERPRHKAIHEK
jgi:DNA-directed RNA polymerase subunit RPC12/RpoP